MSLELDIHEFALLAFDIYFMVFEAVDFAEECDFLRIDFIPIHNINGLVILVPIKTKD